MLDYSSDYRPTNQALLLPTNSINKLVLSPDEVARELQVDVSDVDSLIANGDLIEKKIGDKRRITTNSLLHYLNGESCDVQQPSPGGKHLVTDILDIVLEGKKASCRKLSSYKWYCYNAEHLKDYFQNVFIEDITQDDILAALRIFTKNPNGKLMSERFVQAVSSLLKNTFKYALSKEYISLNPFDYINKIPHGKKCLSKERTLSNKTVVKLVSALNHSPTLKPMILLMLHSGLRIGEVLALKWSDLDEDAGIIHVRRGLSIEYDEDSQGNLVNKHYELGETKTSCSVRDVTIDKATLNTLHEWKAYVKNNKALNRSAAIKGNSDIIFIDRNGCTRNYQTLRKYFDRFLEKYGLSEYKITFHKLRHTYATFLNEAGVDIDIIRDLLGHSDIQTTANIYVKVNITPKRKATQLLSDYFDNSINGNSSID